MNAIINNAVIPGNKSGLIFSLNNKLQFIIEIIKKIFLIAITPLSYLARGIVSVVSYPFTSYAPKINAIETATNNSLFRCGENSAEDFKREKFDYLKNLQFTANCCSYPQLAVYIYHKYKINLSKICEAINRTSASSPDAPLSAKMVLDKMKELKFIS
jgi:hypothetical protein